MCPGFPWNRIPSLTGRCVQHLPLPPASANSGNSSKSLSCKGWLSRMVDWMMKKAAVFVAIFIASAAFPSSAHSQLVRETTAPPQQQQNSAKAQTPAGKERASQEVQLTAEEPWTDTGIAVQPGGNVLITATANLRHAAATAH